MKSFIIIAAIAIISACATTSQPPSEPCGYRLVGCDDIRCEPGQGVPLMVATVGTGRVACKCVRSVEVSDGSQAR